MAYTGDCLLATSSFDGTIVIWNTRAPRVVKKFSALEARLAKGAPALPDLTPGCKPAVEQVLWLEKRVQQDKRRHATLAACADDGMVYLWDAMAGCLMGGFVAIQQKTEPSATVTCLASDMANAILIAADTFGAILVWDIANYCTGTNIESPSCLQAWPAHSAVRTPGSVIGRDCVLISPPPFSLYPT